MCEINPGINLGNPNQDPSQTKELYKGERLLADKEKQLFIQSLYRQEKITNSMESLVVDPIKEFVDIDRQSSLNINLLTSKSLPTLYQWQQGESPNLTYEEFKQVLANETLDEDLKAIFLQQYILRVVKQYYQLVSLPENYQGPQSDETEKLIQFGIQKDEIEKISEDIKKVRILVSKIRTYGVDKISNHYRIIQEIKAAKSLKDLDIIRNLIINNYPDIKPDANPNNLDELSREVFFTFADKKEKLQQETKTQDETSAPFAGEYLSRKLNDQFKTAYEYLTSLIPKEKRRFLDRSPYFVLKLVMALRRILPVADTEVLAQIWWQLRLGGNRSKYAVEYIKKDWPKLYEKQRLEKYSQHLFDNFLGSEAASFEFQNIVSIDESITPNMIIFQVMKNLIKNHKPKTQNVIRFTIFDRDDRVLKIAIPYQEGLTDSEIKQRIQDCMKINHQWKEIQLKDEERAELSYLGYNAKKRKKNINYQNIYQGFGVDPKTQENYNGDYLIQIGSVYEDSRDPRSLFAVNSHQLAVQVKFEEVGKIKITTRYNHQYFDGQPAKIHTDSLINEINQTEAEPMELTNSLIKNSSQISYLKDRLDQPETLKLPLTEARADYEDTYQYRSISLPEGVHLTSTDLRCLTIAIANGIEYYHQLVASQKIGPYFITNPYADNIQPVVVSPKALEEKGPIKWAEDHRKAIERAKKSLGDPALFSSIAGRKEIPLSFAGRLLNPYLINMLTHSQGMISPVPLGKIIFTTAFSDVYRPVKIDLNDPQPSMGIIGMSIDKEKKIAHYTVRLLPSQGQRKLKEKIEQLMVDNLTPKQKQEVLRKFTQIIQAWDNLLSGQGPNNQITFEEYIRIRDGRVNYLVKKKLINPEKLQGKTIQEYLNEGLQEAAKEIFDQKKIADAREKILRIFQN